MRATTFLRGSSVPRKAIQRSVPSLPARAATSSPVGGWNTSGSKPSRATTTRDRSAPVSRSNSDAVASLTEITPTDRLEAIRRSHQRKKGAFTRVCTSGRVKNVRSWMVTTRRIRVSNGNVQCTECSTSRPSRFASRGSATCSQSRRIGVDATAAGAATTSTPSRSKPATSAGFATTTRSRSVRASSATTPST